MQCTALLHFYHTTESFPSVSVSDKISANAKGAAEREPNVTLWAVVAPSAERTETEGSTCWIHDTNPLVAVQVITRWQLTPVTGIWRSTETGEHVDLNKTKQMISTWSKSRLCFLMRRKIPFAWKHSFQETKLNTEGIHLTYQINTSATILTGGATALIDVYAAILTGKAIWTLADEVGLHIVGASGTILTR